MRDGGSTPVPAAVDPRAVETELDRLTAESRRRQHELLEIAARLPAAVSRRSLLRQMLVDLGRAPDKSLVLRRTAVKVARTPTDVIRRVAGR